MSIDDRMSSRSNGPAGSDSSAARSIRSSAAARDRTTHRPKMPAIRPIASPMWASFSRSATQSTRSDLPHWNTDATLPGDVERQFVAGVGVADDAHAGVGGQDALEAA